MSTIDTHEPRYADARPVMDDLQAAESALRESARQLDRARGRISRAAGRVLADAVAEGDESA